MEVTVIGRHAPYPPAGGACSGYLVRSGGTRVLIDGGPGVASRLMQLGGVEQLDAVLISHLHEDHISDLHCLQFAVMAAQWDGRRSEPLALYAPPEPVRQRQWLNGIIPGVMEVHDLPVAEGLTLGTIRIAFGRTEHPIPCYAMRVTNGQSVLFYSADTNRNADDVLVPLAAGAHLAIVEASLLEALAERRQWGHMTAGDAADFGQRAGVRRLLLTHVWPGSAEIILAEARSVWPAAELAEEMRTYPVGP